jgi:hypothetical protein
MSYLQQRLSSHYQIDTVEDGSEKGLTGVKVTAYYQRLLNNVFKYRHAFHHFEDYLSMHLGNSVNAVADAVKWRCMIETYKLAGQNVSTNDNITSQCESKYISILSESSRMSKVYLNNKEC